jgi:glycosyltransferase involved in cell wall biosynthesis
MVKDGRLSVLANGVDVDRWQPNAIARREAREELGIADDFLWLAAGRLEPVKDYPSLLNAFARADRRAQLMILGAGPLESVLKQMAEALGIARRVRFAGFRTNVERWMQAADGIVLSSRYEGLPMVLLEAGACGVPAVATDVAGTREVILKEETGWLAAAGDPDGLATAMNRLMHTPAKQRRELGARARQHVVRNFSLDAVLDRWEALYSDLLGRKELGRRIGPTPSESLWHRGARSA